MDSPRVEFVVTPDRVTIAYQVWGEGEVNIVNLSMPPHSLDWRWSHPGLEQLWEYMAALGRNALIDLRGNGASDAVPLERAGDIDTWATDVLSVMDACGMESAVFFCAGLGGHVGMKVAVEAPERVDGLWLSDCTLRLDPTVVEPIVRFVAANWGTGRVSASSGPQTTPISLESHARLERLSAPRNLAAAMVRRSLAHDATDLARRVGVPALAVHTGTLSFATAEDSHAVSEAIPGADFVDLSAGGSMLFRPVTAEAMATFEQFIVGHVVERWVHEVTTIVFTDIVASTDRAATVGDESWADTLDQLSRDAERCAQRHGAELVKDTGDGYLLVVPGVADALRLACSLIDLAREAGVDLRAGAHTGSVIRRGGDVAGIAVNIAARVMAQAAANRVWASRTVVDVLGGAGFRFTERGEHELRGVPGRWQLFELQP